MKHFIISQTSLWGGILIFYLYMKSGNIVFLGLFLLLLGINTYYGILGARNPVVLFPDIRERLSADINERLKQRLAEQNWNSDSEPAPQVPILNHDFVERDGIGRTDAPVKRPVNEELGLAYEVVFVMDGIQPHIWSREGKDSYGQLYCETDLTDEEWDFYTKLAKGEHMRIHSTMPDEPVFYESMVGRTCEYNVDIQDKIMKRLNSKGSLIEDDVSEWHF